MGKDSSVSSKPSGEGENGFHRLSSDLHIYAIVLVARAHARTHTHMDGWVGGWMEGGMDGWILRNKGREGGK